ncbi:response regulator transcription factor [Flavobacterium hibernum]|uniref:Response regulator n=1 Tax=Flavobacterium hibernum TaxID=37752 RepID=A0A0D0F4K1_9FLAO|nr:response regulator [Flavobacterium hibernum]KIO54561.1 transcriptional regulator [Flavobacterium hibernum]OXA84624.1 response regulator [Flavobacterium hibernum]STO10313.1 Mycobacterial persistence regulator A [Flavobacterium hibernum]
MAKILIIDDEETLRITICELLSFVGHKICEAEDGRDGLEKVKEFKPDVILCDIMMPKLDGYGFMEEHIASEYSYIPVIFLSAKIEPKDRKMGGILGVKHFLKKTFVFSELKQLIENYL